MLNVERNNTVWDVQHVLDAVLWAYQRSQAEDEMWAARNISGVVQYSPLTRKLQEAYSTLLELDAWIPPGDGVVYNVSPVDS